MPNAKITTCPKLQSEAAQLREICVHLLVVLLSVGKLFVMLSTTIF